MHSSMADESCWNVFPCIHRSVCHPVICAMQRTFKTFLSTGDESSTFSSIFFGGIAFGLKVFLRCHTDADFTKSISQVFLKGRPEYHVNDDVITYFCFPTLGVSVLLRPGDYFMFNALITQCLLSRCTTRKMRLCAPPCICRHRLLVCTTMTTQIVTSCK